MIPYELIIPSASRPHLLDEVLRTMFARLDQMPARVLLHDDAVFPGRQWEVAQVLAERVPRSIPTILLQDDPPIKHGPSLKRLLDLVSTEYVLYTQDDHKVVRDLPIEPALSLLHQHGLNQIRFNKRDTMDKKGREGAEFFKVEKWFRCKGLPYKWGQDAIHGCRDADAKTLSELVPLCIADHFYFQTNIFRVSALKPILDWWMGPGRQHGAFDEHCEVKVNQTFNGQWLAQHGPLGPDVPILLPHDGAWNDPEVRARIHKTFIWGRVGEPRFVEHVGTDPKDWALIRGNRDQPGVKP